MVLCLSDQSSQLGPLERDRGAFGVMFVISVAVPGGRDHTVEVASQAYKAPKYLLTQRVKSPA